MTEDLGIGTVLYYYQRSLAYGQELGWQDFQDHIRSISPSFFQNFGVAVQAASDLSNADLRNAMSTLADQAQGALPNSHPDLDAFFEALRGQYSGVANWTRIVKGTAVETGEAIVTGAKVIVGGTAIYVVFIVGFFALAMLREK